MLDFLWFLERRHDTKIGLYLRILNALVLSNIDWSTNKTDRYRNLLDGLEFTIFDLNQKLKNLSDLLSPHIRSHTPKSKL